MSYLSLCQNRKSVHSFLPNYLISDKAFAHIMESVRLSPSGYNAQPWKFVLIRDVNVLKEIQKIAFGQKHITQAGNLVAVFANTQFGNDDHDRILQDWKEHRNYTPEQLAAMSNALKKERSPEQWKSMALRNAALATSSFLYAATDSGWATCPMMGFSQRKLKQVLSVPETWAPVLLIALGKEDPSKVLPQMPRKSVDEITAYESFFG